MLNNIKSCYLRQKGSFTKRLVLIAPIAVVLINFLLYGFSTLYLMQGAYNWFTVLISPIILAMISGFMINMEKKKNYHSLFAVEKDKKKIWLSIVVIASIFFIIYSLTFYIFSVGLTIIRGGSVDTKAYLLATITIVLAYLWQIPFWILISEKIGSIITIIASTVINMTFSLVFSIKSLWFIPFAIPAKFCLATVGILPNGLLTENIMDLDKSVLLPGIVISLGLFFTLTYLGAIYFERKEV